MRKTVLCLAFFLAIGLTGARGDMWTVLAPGTDVMCIARDNSGHMWCGGTFGATRLDRWGFTKDIYTSADGLAGHPVTDIAIGADGRKWFATWSAGLSCLDGENWTTYNMDNSGLESNHLQALAIDDQGRIWIGSERHIGDRRGGVYVFDGESWTNYNTLNSGLAFDRVWDVTIDAEGKKWFATSCGVSMFDDVSWVTYNAGNSGLASDLVNSIAIGPLGRKWIGTYEGISIFDGDHWQTFNKDNSPLSSNVVGRIEFDPTGRMWAASGGLCVFDGTTWTIYTFENSGLLSDGVAAIEFDTGGRVWIGTYAGLCVFNGTTWRQHDPGNCGMPTSPISPFQEDSLGRIWSRTEGRGYDRLCILDGDTWTSFDTSNSEMQYERIGGVAVDQYGVAWISTWHMETTGFGQYEYHCGGLVSYNGFDWVRYTPTDSGLGWNLIQDIAIDAAGRKWVAATDAAHYNPYDRRKRAVQGGTCGVSVFDGDEWTNYDSTNSGLPSTGVRKITIDHEDRIWFDLNEGGLCVFNGESWTTYNTSNSMIPTNDIWCIDFDRQNNLWFVGDDQTICSFDGMTWRTYDPPEELWEFQDLETIAVDKNDVKWFTNSASGVFSLDGETWRHYDTSNSAIAYDMFMLDTFVDSHNRKWFSGGYGGLSILTEGAPPGGTPPSEPSGPSPQDGAAVSSSPIILSWQCEDADPGDTVRYDLMMLTSADTGTDMATAAVGLIQSEFELYPLPGEVKWQVTAYDERGNRTTGPSWSFEAAFAGCPLTVASARLEPESPVVGEPAKLRLTLINEGPRIESASCLIWIEGRDYRELTSYDCTWWTDGDMLFGLSDVDTGDTIEVERTIAIMAPTYACDSLVILPYIQSSTGDLFHCDEHMLPVTLTANADQYINDVAEALSAMTRGFSLGRFDSDYHSRRRYSHPQRLFQSGAPTYCSSSMVAAVSTRDMEALGKYCALFFASYADLICMDGVSLSHLRLAEWAVRYLGWAADDSGMASISTSELREFVCSFVRHYNLFTAALVERKGFGMENCILAFFYSDDDGSPPAFMVLDGSYGETANIKPERTGTYALDLLRVRSSGVETLSTFENLPLEINSVVIIKALSSDLNEPKVCVDTDGNGAFDHILEASGVERTPAYPIQSLGWNRANAETVGEVKVTFTLVNPGPVQDIDIYIACDLGDGQLLFYPEFTPAPSGIPFMVPVYFYLERFSLIEAQIPYGLAIEPIHFYCGISSPGEFRLLRPIDIL